MFKINKIIFLLITVFCILAALVFLAFNEAKILRRDPSVLMNRYYLLKQKNPDAAENALSVILRQDASYLPALNELSQIYIRKKNTKAALPLLEQLHAEFPDDPKYTQQLAYLYYDNGNWQQARSLFAQLVKETSPGFKQEALVMLDKMASYFPYYRTYALADLKNVKQQSSSSRVVPILLDYYYKIKKDTPVQAKNLLALLDLLSQDNPLIHEEMGYIALQKGDQDQAISYFSRAYDETASPQLALQLAYLYMNKTNHEKAASLFLLASSSNDPRIRNAAFRGYDVANMNGHIGLTNELTAQKSMASEDTLLLDQYFALKKHNTDMAWVLIQQIIKKYPNNIMALKEGGFLAIDKGHRAKAITYFTKAYELTWQPDLAMQLGYLYDQTPNKALAYRYFIQATRTKDKNLELRAQNAMTNLAGLQTKALPPPYFGELFFDPFSQSRFGLTVRPLVARLGIENNNKLQTKEYLVFRQTEDNKSESLGQLPQIYEDNVRIIGGGLQITPIKNFPVVGFVEAGMAYDLVYRDRDRWRGDLRGGLMYYNEFGKIPAYFNELKIGTDYYSTLYGDITYFSRYDNNVIGTLKTHQGIRLAQYKSSMLNLYLSGRVIEDTRREFFNNIAEIGPGIGFIPSNRFRVQLRYEHLKGIYLPAGGSFNPYGKYYTNNIVQLFVYAKI